MWKCARPRCRAIIGPCPAGGGEPGDCGWLKDRFGLSWQVNWTSLIDMLRDADRKKAGRAMQAMLATGKLDVAALQKAYEGA